MQQRRAATRRRRRAWRPDSYWLGSSGHFNPVG